MSGYEEEHNIPRDSIAQHNEASHGSRRTDFSSFFSFLDSIDTTHTRTEPEVADVRSALALAANGYRAMLGETEGFAVEGGAEHELISNPVVQSMLEALEHHLGQGPRAIKGMPDSFFEGLERVPKKKLKADQTCPICTNPFVDDPYPLVVRLPCNKNHMFDLECIQPWLKVETTCPLDRKDLAPKKEPVKPVKPIDEEEEEEWNDIRVELDYFARPPKANSARDYLHVYHQEEPAKASPCTQAGMKSLQRLQLASRVCIPKIYRPFGSCPFTTRTNHVAERVTVKTRSNGLFTLDLYHPSSDSPSSRPIILYLPNVSDLLAAQLNLENSHDDDSVPLQLSATSQATIVKINYRLSPQHIYPVPVHDAVAGLDWAVENLLRRPKLQDVTAGALPGPGMLTTPSPSAHPGIGVYGDFIGGGLAAALALTECRASSTTRIAAAVVNNPVLDWTSLDKALLTPPTGKTNSGKKKAKLPSDADDNAADLEHQARTSELQALISLRSRLFQPQRPSTYFDPFASPMLFLRTPGVETPLALSDRVPYKSTVPELLHDDIMDEELTFSDPDLDAKFADLMGLEAERAHEQGQQQSRNSTATLFEPDVDAEETLKSSPEASAVEAVASANRRSTPRRQPRHYPPSDWGETIVPRFLITSTPSPYLTAQLGLGGSDDSRSKSLTSSVVLRTQAEEFTNLLRRAIIRSRLGPLPTRKQLERRFFFLGSGGGPGMDLGAWSSGSAKESWIESEREKLASLRAEKEAGLRSEIEELIELAPTMSAIDNEVKGKGNDYGKIGEWFGRVLREDSHDTDNNTELA